MEGADLLPTVGRAGVQGTSPSGPEGFPRRLPCTGTTSDPSDSRSGYRPSKGQGRTMEIEGRGGPPGDLPTSRGPAAIRNVPEQGCGLRDAPPLSGLSEPLSSMGVSRMARSHGYVFNSPGPEQQGLLWIAIRLRHPPWPAPAWTNWGEHGSELGESRMRLSSSHRFDQLVGCETECLLLHL